MWLAGLAVAGHCIAEQDNEALERVQNPFTPLHPDAGEIAPIDHDVAPVEVAPDPCDWTFEHEEIQEDSRDLVRGVACHSYRWFDSLFGNSEDFPEDSVYGLLTTGLAWNQYDGFKPRLRIKVRAPLPNMDKRWDLMVGRGDDEAIIADTQTQDSTFYNPGLVSTRRDDAWLLGLGHRRDGRRKGWDWSVGLRLRAKPVPYVKTSWFYDKSYSEDTDFRFRQTFFWRNDDGWGSTSRGDHSWGINDENVLRWEALATISEATDDWDWYVGQTWYRLFPDRGSFSLLAFVQGETGRPEPLTEYGLNFIWRQNFTRDWLYISYGPSITWPEYEPEDEREASLGFGVWLEMEFGGTYYR